MDTRLTVLPIALTTVNDSFKIFCFSFFLAVPFFTSRHLMPICPSAHRPPRSLTVTFYFANSVKVC